MDVDAIHRAIKAFLETNRQAFTAIDTNQSKALELAATVGIAEHYRSVGYEVAIVNPKSRPHDFVVKTSTRGYPWNFSHICFRRGDDEFEAHMNLMVSSAHDEGTYCVDVGLTLPGKVPGQAKRDGWNRLENRDLVTFAEVKKLVVYPMLLAQFIGIVHEIKPRFLSRRLPRDFARCAHLRPTLASLGNFSGNSRKIVDAYSGRGIQVEIAENFDIRLARVRGGSVSSPFEKFDENVDEL